MPYHNRVVSHTSPSPSHPCLGSHSLQVLRTYSSTYSSEGHDASSMISPTKNLHVRKFLSSSHILPMPLLARNKHPLCKTGMRYTARAMSTSKVPSTKHDPVRLVTPLVHGPVSAADRVSVVLVLTAHLLLSSIETVLLFIAGGLSLESVMSRKSGIGLVLVFSLPTEFEAALHLIQISSGFSVSSTFSSAM